MSIPSLGDVYTTDGANPRTCVVVWVGGSAWGSVYLSNRMERLMTRFGNKVRFLLVFQYHATKALRRVRAELTYSQW